MLEEGGLRTSRLAFNAADRFFWKNRANLVEYHGQIDELPEYYRNFYTLNTVTDIVLYGDARPVHQAAIVEAKARNIRIHFFEEGYLRPYWVTYERGGVNGDSLLNALDMDEIKARRALRHVDLRDAPAHWGQALQHNWYGFVYHLVLWLGRRRFPDYRPHRGTSITTELRLNAVRLLAQPWRTAKRDVETRRFLLRGYPFFIVLLQLEHDASLKRHSDYDTQKAFIDQVVAAFAIGAPPPTRLVFKLHPFDDGRSPMGKWIAEAARVNGVEDRVMLISGGALSRIISHAMGAITVNSTSVQQMLWRGIPVKLMGRSVFAKPEFASDQDLVDFFHAPKKPSREDFLEFRSFLLETSQLVGGYYTAEGRAEVVRVALSLLPNKQHPYEKNV